MESQIKELKTLVKRDFQIDITVKRRNQEVLWVIIDAETFFDSGVTYAEINNRVTNYLESKGYYSTSGFDPSDPLIAEAQQLVYSFYQQTANTGEYLVDKGIGDSPLNQANNILFNKRTFALENKKPNLPPPGYANSIFMLA